jgi:DNA-directed RNA polymerase subunit RPC12/RpoP
MSLICAECGKIIIMSNNPDHYGKCHGCPFPISDRAKELIEKSSREFKKISPYAWNKKGEK